MVQSQSVKIAGIILTLILISSCVTQKRCMTKYPPIADTVVTVITRDSIVFKDTTVYITLPGETIIDSIVIPCPPMPDYVPDTAKAETDYALAIAWYDPPKLMLRLDQKPSTLEIRLDSALREAYYWKDKYENVSTVQPVKYIPIIYKVALWMVIGVILFVVFTIIVRLARI